MSKPKTKSKPKPVKAKPAKTIKPKPVKAKPKVKPSKTIKSAPKPKPVKAKPAKAIKPKPKPKLKPSPKLSKPKLSKPKRAKVLVSKSSPRPAIKKAKVSSKKSRKSPAISKIMLKKLGDKSEEIIRAIAKSRDKLSRANITADISRLHVNRDNSIDAELIIPLDYDDVDDFEEASITIASSLPYIRDAFSQTTLFYDLVIEDLFDQSDFTRRRYQGADYATIKTKFAATRNKALLKNILARLIAERIEESSNLLPTQMRVRLHWNPEHKKPV